MRDQYFVPVCLYPHTKYRTAAGVTDLFEKFQLSQHGYLCVVADRLLVLDRLVTGRYWSENSAVIKARKEGEQILKLIRNVARKLKAHEPGRVVFWDEIERREDFPDFASALRTAVLADATMAAAMDEFVDRRIARFGLGSDRGKERGYEREYLLSEVCMSVYCTEMLGFFNEIWERPPHPDVPDPLKLLYDRRRNIVSSVTGRPAARALSFLYKTVDKHKN